jgi:putative hemolysin
MSEHPSTSTPDVSRRATSRLVDLREHPIDPGHTCYCARIAQTDQDVAAVQKLRYEVFNVELKEGLVSSQATGHDSDAFDAHCDHLVVEEQSSGLIVGTYRLLPGARALEHGGFYSALEFDFSPFLSCAGRFVELGRACVHQDHRHLAVLKLMWRSIWTYAESRGARYLIGCSSLSSQDPSHGSSVFSQLERHYLAPLPWRTQPLPHCTFPLTQSCHPPYRIPKLLRAYLYVGAWICGPPAIDREFGTIDFLTLFDMNQLASPKARLDVPLA